MPNSVQTLLHQVTNQTHMPNLSLEIQCALFVIPNLCGVITQMSTYFHIFFYAEFSWIKSGCFISHSVFYFG